MASISGLTICGVCLLTFLFDCGAPSHRSEASASPPAIATSSGTGSKEIVLRDFPEHPLLWIYGVDNHPTDKKLRPCIFIAPAGSPMVTGMKLGDRDRDEHIPYVRAGYVVVAYEVSGSTDDLNPVALRLFAKRDTGIANGKAAIDYALRNLPIDPKRLYTVGHSSAGTLALQVAAADPRIGGCVAYAPVTDVVAHLGASISQIPPELASAVRRNSPLANVKKLRCPTMLFSAQDDTTVDPSGVRGYAKELSKLNHSVELVTVESGGHYDSMIHEGIPAGLRWLKGKKK